MCVKLSERLTINTTTYQFLNHFSRVKSKWTKVERNLCNVSAANTTDTPGHANMCGVCHRPLVQRVPSK